MVHKGLRGFCVRRLQTRDRQERVWITTKCAVLSTVLMMKLLDILLHVLPHAGVWKFCNYVVDSGHLFGGALGCPRSNFDATVVGHECVDVWEDDVGLRARRRRKRKKSWEELEVLKSLRTCFCHRICKHPSAFVRGLRGQLVTWVHTHFEPSQGSNKILNLHLTSSPFAIAV